METFLFKALQLIAALVLLVTVHEFGHYIFARMFGIKVNRFYLFFNPGFSLLKYDPRANTLQIISHADGKAWKTVRVGRPHPATEGSRPTWRDTIYGLGWLPLGGYCDISGMVDETKSSADLAAEPQPWEFRSKAAWKRLLVMVAGVLLNFVLAICIYIGIAAHWGERVVPYQEMTEGMDFSDEMHAAGFRDGDRLLAINGKPIDTRKAIAWDMIQPGTRVTVLRNGTDTVSVPVDDDLLQSVVATNAPYMSTRVPVYIDRIMSGDGAARAGLQPGDRILAVGNDTTPALTEFFPALKQYAGRDSVPFIVARDGRDIVVPVDVNDDGKIGIQLTAPDKIFNVVEIRYNIFQAIPRGIRTGVDQLTTYVSSCKLLFTKEGAKSVGGFGTLGSLFPEKWNWYSFWSITAFLSVILAFMNIIPIPALDGGYIFFLFIEIITRRKPSEKFIEVANMIGIAFLFMLLVYANANDVYRLILK